MTAEQWAALGSVGALVIYIVLGVIGFIQIRQARTARELQSRPYVIVDFEFRRFVIYVVIRNIGQTPARNVRVKFARPLQQSTAMRERNVNDAAALNQPIAMLAPQRSIWITFDVSHQVFKETSLPLAYEVSSSYESLDGRRQYNDPSYTMDLSHRRNAAIEPKSMPDLIAEVQMIREEVHKWTDGARGLFVRSEDRSVAEGRRLRPMLRSIAHEELQKNGLTAYLRWQVNNLRDRFGWRMWED